MNINHEIVCVASATAALETTVDKNVLGLIYSGRSKEIFTADGRKLGGVPTTIQLSKKGRFQRTFAGGFK